MARCFLLIIFFLPALVLSAQDFTSPTEGVITDAFVEENVMKRDLLQMLAKFSTYISADWQKCSEQTLSGEQCGYFKGENSGANDERGVRANADLSMICSFLVKYAKPNDIALPTGVTWEDLDTMAMQSLVYAYSTHKANRLKKCTNGKYWGSVSAKDYCWESSLWAMSVAYSAFFQWNKLMDEQKNCIYNLLKAECNYELERTIPTGYIGDTKAEENGWEVDVLAVTLGLFPNDELAPAWFDRMRAFAINSYSHPNDKFNDTTIDPLYDNTTISDLYRGQNLYEDYSLQNHSLFHTSYQNVVIQELGEAALALMLFNNGKWLSNSLLHNCLEVEENILNWLALADGELAMPNGNDWSMFLYDQITSYSTLACFKRDSNALMLENLAYKNIKARQTTTNDGSWLLRADVGSRRMGVEAHRIMMTYLMHEILSTSDLSPNTWEGFRRKYSNARLIKEQNVVRAYTPWKFSCFSWSEGLKSYTGYFTSNKADKNKIIIPFRAHNTGNLLGWYEVEGKNTNAVPAISGIYLFDGDTYIMNGELLVNDSSLTHSFAVFSTNGKALAYIDYVTANKDCVINAEKGGLLAISNDEFTRISRKISKGNDWINIDDEIGIVSNCSAKEMYYGNESIEQSIRTKKLYALYCDKRREIKQGQLVDARNVVYYTDTNSEETKTYSKSIRSLKDKLPAGWNGVSFEDNGMEYVFVSNFCGKNQAKIFGRKIELQPNNSMQFNIRKQ